VLLNHPFRSAMSSLDSPHYTPIYLERRVREENRRTPYAHLRDRLARICLSRKTELSL
jgi:hypothetical protein